MGTNKTFWVVAAACTVVACGGGSSGTPANNVSSTSVPVGTLEQGNTALAGLATAFTTPTAIAARTGGSATALAVSYLDWLPLAQAQADEATDANGCTPSGSPGTLANANHYAVKDVLCHLTATDSTARNAVPKVLATMSQLGKALENAGALKFDGVDRPGSYTLVVNNGTTYPNQTFDKVIGTAPASFGGVADTGFDYGIEFNKTGTTGQYWRIAIAKADTGYKIKWLVNSSQNTANNPAGEGFEVGYLEVITANGQRTVRVLQTLHPNQASTFGAGALSQQLYGQQAAADTSAYYSTLSYARLSNALPLASGAVRMTVAQNVQGQNKLKVQAYDRSGSEWQPAAAQALCAATVGSAPEACTPTITVNTDAFANYRTAYASDADAWVDMKTRFASYGSAFSSWTTAPGITSSAAALRVLPHSGITASQCYQAGSNTLVACDSAGSIALSGAGKQDGMLASVNAMGYSAVGSYSKEECVKDNVTGLVWEGKTASGLRAGSNTYTNYDSTSSPQKWNGSEYVNPTQSEIDASTNSVGYVAAVNAQGLCGYTDWRLPTVDELQSIVDYSVAYPGPTINSSWFPSTPASMSYWASSPIVGSSTGVWGVNFAHGFVGTDNRNPNYAVRLVRASR